jgi:citrate synthase
MQEIRSALPDRSPMPLMQVLIHASWPASKSPSAPPEANIDFALAVLTGVAGMIPGAGEVIFAVTRTADWLAHALEEYARDSPIRPRGVYTGPPRCPPEPPAQARAGCWPDGGRRAPLGGPGRRRWRESDCAAEHSC